MAADEFGQGIDFTDIFDAADAEALVKNLTDAMLSRGVLRFANAAARTAGLPDPEDGMFSTLADTMRLYRYDGTAESWVVVVPQFKFGIFTVSFTGLDQKSQSVNFSGAAFSGTPLVFVNIASSAGGTSRWTARADSSSPTGFTALFQSGLDGATANWSNIPCWYLAVAA